MNIFAEKKQLFSSYLFSTELEQENRFLSVFYNLLRTLYERFYREKKLFSSYLLSTELEQENFFLSVSLCLLGLVLSLQAVPHG